MMTEVLQMGAKMDLNSRWESWDLVLTVVILQVDAQ